MRWCFMSEHRQFGEGFTNALGIECGGDSESRCVNISSH